MRTKAKTVLFFLVLSSIITPFLTMIPQAKADSDEWQVEANDDDAYRKLTPSAYDKNLLSNIAGYWKFGQEKYGSGFRFINMGIPAGAEITSASLILTARITNGVGTPRTRISAEAEDNPGTFTTLIDFDTRYADNTDTVIDWDTLGAWVQDTEYTSVDIKTVIQEIIDRDGWSSGNSMVLFWEDFDDRSTHLDNSRRHAYAHDDDPTKAPKLNITWVLPLESPDKLFGAGFNSSSPYVSLYWKTNLTDISFFEVQNSTDKISWDYLGQNTTAEYHDFQVVNGTERYYRVRACNFTGVFWDNSTFTDINFETVYFVMPSGEGECLRHSYNASSIAVIVGTLNDGDLASTYAVDGDWYNVSEINDMPGLDIRINFTGVCEDTICGCLDIYHTYTGHSQHEIAIEFYNFTSNTWIQRGAFIYNETAGWVCIGLGDTPNHFVNNGTLWARFYHAGQGHLNHELHIDSIKLNAACGEHCPSCPAAISGLLPGLAIGISLLIIASAYIIEKRR